MPGEPLPSVRELAEQHRRRADDGQPGLWRPEGCRPDRDAARLRHVRDRQRRRRGWPPGPRQRELHRRIDALIDAGIAAGHPPGRAASRWSARAPSTATASAAARSDRHDRLFAEATRELCALHRGPPRHGRHRRAADHRGDRARSDARARANSADLVVTFANRQREVTALVPNTKVVSISFIPSEETRKALAALDPLARVARRLALSGFPADHEGRRAALRAACRRHLTGATLDDAGARATARRVRRGGLCHRRRGRRWRSCAPGVAGIEYRHTPDPAEIERVLVPLDQQRPTAGMRSARKGKRRERFPR